MSSARPKTNFQDSADCRDEDPELLLSHLPLRLRKNLVIQNGHWIWVGQVNNKGYGMVHAAFPAQPQKPPGKRAVHVVIYELLVGLVPPDLELDHTCPYKLCAFPGCLDEVTHAENQRRIGERLTHCRKRNHERTPANTYTNPTTGRTSCRACARERDAKRTPRRWRAA